MMPKRRPIECRVKGDSDKNPEYRPPPRRRFRAVAHYVIAHAFADANDVGRMTDTPQDAGKQFSDVARVGSIFENRRLVVCIRCRGSIEVIIIHVNEEIHEFGKKVVVIEHEVGDLDGRSRIRANELPLRCHHIPSLRGDLERLEDCDILLLSEQDSGILGADKQCEDIYML